MFTFHRWVLVAQAVVETTGRVVAESVMSKHFFQKSAVKAEQLANALKGPLNKNVNIVYVVKKSGTLEK